jgi:hypothetical protein
MADLDLSAIADRVARMTYMHPPLLEEVEAFLARTKMGEAYFGKKAVGNSELVARLRAGGSVLVTTDEKVRAFMASNPVTPDALACVSDGNTIAAPAQTGAE